MRADDTFERYGNAAACLHVAGVPDLGRGAALRLMAEYLEPLRRFRKERIRDTVVFFGSARTRSREAAERHLAEVQAGKGLGTRSVDAGGEGGDQGSGVVAVLRGRPCAVAPADDLVLADSRALSPLRRVLGRRPRHHGSRQPRRARGRRQEHRAEHPAAVRAGTRTRTSRRSCTSSSTTSSCASSGSPTSPRRWWSFPAASARSTSCSRS